jgi:Rrf2 family protein
MPLRLTRAADYAVQAMVHLACLPEDAVVLRSDIARIRKIPSSFMAKILRNLVEAGLLRSTRGARGGFALARPAAEITLLEIMEAIEGKFALVDCTTTSCTCEWADECPAQPVWLAVQSKIAELLRSSTLEDLVSAPHRRRATVVPLSKLPEEAFPRLRRRASGAKGRNAVSLASSR